MVAQLEALRAAIDRADELDVQHQVGIAVAGAQRRVFDPLFEPHDIGQHVGENAARRAQRVAAGVADLQPEVADGRAVAAPGVEQLAQVLDDVLQLLVAVRYLAVAVEESHRSS